MGAPLQFLLSPDRGAARRLRRALAERGAGLDIAAGTWSDLLERVRLRALVSPPVSAWREQLREALPAFPDAFWSKSLEVAPDETAVAVETSYVGTLRGLQPGTRLTDAARRAGKQLAERARRHLADLAQLHERLDGALPDELSTVCAVLEAPRDEALGQIVVQRRGGLPRLDAWQRALLARLESDARASGAEPERALQELLDQCLQSPPSARETSALGHLQRHLFAADSATALLDLSVQWLGVRDALEELEVVAGMIQRELDRSAELAPRDFALLLPDDPFTRAQARSVFDAAGLALSGLEEGRPRRDLAHEAIYAFLQCQRVGAPAMARATLLSSPLLPWSGSTAMALADQVMLGRRPNLADDGSEQERDALQWVKARPVTSPEQLVGRLRVFVTRLADRDEFSTAQRDARQLVEDLVAQLDGQSEIPWDFLERSALPRRLSASDATATSPYTLEGISVLDESTEPWRVSRRLFVLGCSAGHHPADPGSSSVFTDRDVAALASAGFDLATGAELLSERRGRFRRQLSASSDAVAFLVPRRAASGEAQAPSSSLTFMAKLFEGVEEADSLIRELDTESGRSAAHGLALAEPCAPAPPRAIPVHDLALGRNLLELGNATQGEISPQSPSRLDTLLVSPLAWLLERAELSPRSWAPEEMSPMLQGTLAHAVFEALFAPGAPLLSEEALRERAATLLHEAISRHAAFALGRAWRVERTRLEAEVQEAALAWARLLSQLGARVLASEISLEGWLSGVTCEGVPAPGLPLRGTADALLALPDGALSVVDYKKSRSDDRRTRMQKGFDLQASLYRAMLETRGPVGAEHAGLRAEVERASRIGVLYYTLNDQTALADGELPAQPRLDHFEALGDAVSVAALARLRTRLREVAAGRVALNHERDEKTLPKEYGVKLHALDSIPLLRIFLHRGAEDAEEQP